MLKSRTAGMAMARPNAVTTSASEMPPATELRPAEPVTESW